MTTDPIPPHSRHTTKPIPPARDRLQSRILVWVAVPVLCYLSASSIWDMTESPEPTVARVFLRIAIPSSILFALTAWRLRAATPLAAACGGMICLLLTESIAWPQTSFILHTGLSPLILLFILTFEATRLGRNRKEEAGAAEGPKGRNGAQVIANLGIAALLNSPWTFYITYWTVGIGGFEGTPDSVAHLFAFLKIPMLAALAEAAADTVSSEIGQAFGGQPILLTTLHPVPPGTDGAISPIGTIAGIAAAAVIAFSGVLAMSMTPTWCAVAFAAGVLGLFFDSLLGATFERRGWINNDLVNFASTAFAAVVSLLAMRLL